MSTNYNMATGFGSREASKLRKKVEDLGGNYNPNNIPHELETAKINGTYDDISLMMIPSAVSDGKVHNVIPENSNFTNARTGVVETLDASGNVVSNPTDMPLIDYRGTFVPSADASNYNADATTGKVTIPVQTFADGESWTVTTKGAFDSDNTFGFIIGSSGNQNLLISKNGTTIAYRSSSNTYYDFLKTFSSIQNVDTEFTWVCNGTTISLYVDGVLDSTITPDFTDLVILKFIKGYSNDTLGCSGQIKKALIDNRELTASEVLDRYNGVAIPDKYVGADNVSYTAGAFTIGKNYRIDTIGTTDFTLIGASANTVGLEFTATGVGSGTGTATSVGNALNLDGGKTATTWYDLDHPITGAIIGATLNNSNGFSTNQDPIDSCPHLALLPACTNLFQDSSNPATQTINTVVGTTYTLEVFDKGIATVAEVGGGRGGAATEVLPYTYTATKTSVTITMVAGHSFTGVNFIASDTGFKAHIPTAAASTASITDSVISTLDISAFATVNYDVYFEIDVKNDVTSNTTFILDNAGGDYVAVFNNIFDISFGGSYSLPIGKNKILAQNNATDFKLFVNGVNVFSDVRNTTILDILSLKDFTSGIIDYYSLEYQTTNRTSAEAITKTT